MRLRLLLHPARGLPWTCMRVVAAAIATHVVPHNGRSAGELRRLGVGVQDLVGGGGGRWVLVWVWHTVLCCGGISS